MNYHNIVLIAKDYEKIDGREAYQSPRKMFSLGTAEKNQPEHAGIKAKIWEDDNVESWVPSSALPLHQVLDLAIFSCRALLYFQDAYRFPRLFDPANPSVESIGLQGSVMPVSICVDNPVIDEDIRRFSQKISDDGEIIGERLRVLSRLMKEMGY